MPVPGRRNFLVRCCQAAAAFFISPRQTHPESRAPALHIHPQYREHTLLDTVRLQLDPALDVFQTEKFHPQIAQVLDSWSDALLKQSQDIQVIERVIGEGFQGTSWRPVESRSLRPAPFLDVRQLTFSERAHLAKPAFLAEVKASLASFSKILSAEFQVTAIDSNLKVRVLYGIVGAGPGFYREQRSGSWVLTWESGHITQWLVQQETRTRSQEQCFTDITRAAFGSNSSYAAQLLHGADYWRGILDGACGIDIYGHNGVSAGDIDGDGLDDVYVCQPAGLPNRLYRNLGNGTFEDITEGSGVGLLDNTACALFADLSNSGRQDLVIVRAAGPLLFRNQGNGKFQLQTNAFQFANPPQGTFTGASAADYNRDGYLDIYFCLYTYYQGAGQYKYPTPYFAAENGPPNFLMHNNGDGTFRDVTAACGLDKNNTRFSFCCGWGDFNRDGWPDLYVVNDFGRKNLYRNSGDGTFTDIAAELDVEDVGAGMSVAWLDYNDDGREDLYVANMWTAAGERITSDESFQKTASGPVQSSYRKHAMGNSLFQSEGNAFRNVTQRSQTGNGRWSWSSDGWDFDHDGYSDIYVANGMISGVLQPDLNSFFWRQVVAKSPNTPQSSSDYELGWNAVNEMIREGYSWSGFERNILFANSGDGTFCDVAGALGLDFPEDSRSFALADFNGDGRQELLLKNRNAPQLRLLQNSVTALPPAISFRLQGTRSNRDAVGAVVTVGKQSKSLQAGSGFLSQHSKELFFGLGSSPGAVSATIEWPSGQIQHLNHLPPGHRVSVIEAVETPKVEPFKPAKKISEAETSLAFPKSSETWLLVPISAPGISPGNPQVLSITKDSDPEQIAIYNLLFRYVFDYHRDLSLPASFLIDEQARIVKIYQGPVASNAAAADLRQVPKSDPERFARALPFSGASATFTYGRNYLSLGSIFFQRGYPDPARHFFESALKDDPSSSEAWYGLGSVYLKQQDDSRAKESFEQVTRLKAAYPETTPNAWNNLGLLAARAGDTATAIAHFERVLQLDPNHFIALQNLGSAYRQQQRWQLAQATLERGLAIKPADPEANYSLGMVFAQIGDTAKAYSYFERALQARPAYPEALNNLGILYLRTHRRNEAVTAFQDSIRLAPGFDQSYMNLARVYSIEGDAGKARSVLQALLAQHPGHPGAQQALQQLNPAK